MDVKQVPRSVIKRSGAPNVSTNSWTFFTVLAAVTFYRVLNLQISLNYLLSLLHTDFQGE